MGAVRNHVYHYLILSITSILIPDFLESRHRLRHLPTGTFRQNFRGQFSNPLEIIENSNNPSPVTVIASGLHQTSQWGPCRGAFQP